MTPIGFFQGPKKFKNQAASQATYEISESEGRVVLHRELPYRDMLRGLETFTHIWVIFGFHHNEGWSPVVEPPRGPRQGVLATRSPYRPNALGMSALELHAIEDNELIVGAHDLLEGSPIYDIKPYLKESDSLPHAGEGWVGELKPYEVRWEPGARRCLEWLCENGVTELENFAYAKLRFEPLDRKKKRLKELAADAGVLCYRTWRMRFRVEDTVDIARVWVEDIFSGYGTSEIESGEDPYADKDTHRAFARAKNSL